MCVYIYMHCVYIYIKYNTIQTWKRSKYIPVFLHEKISRCNFKRKAKLKNMHCKPPCVLTKTKSHKQKTEYISMLLKPRRIKGIPWALLTSEVSSEIYSNNWDEAAAASRTSITDRTAKGTDRERHRQGHFQGGTSGTRVTGRAPRVRGRGSHWPRGPESTWEEAGMWISHVRAGNERGRQHTGNSNPHQLLRNKMYFCLKKKKKES